MTILDEIAAYTRKRIEEEKKSLPPDELMSFARSLPGEDFSFEKALKKDDIAFICECKKASPSKGVIAEEFPYLSIADDYERAGADAISVLTEPKWFMGADAYLQEIAEQVSIPCLRKDFTIDDYMIFQAKVNGAAAVLLIVSILSLEELKAYIQTADSLGLSALVEAHDADEIRTALQAGARIVGVNNRNLKDFSVDTDNSRRLREMVPPEVIFIAESGIQTAADVDAMRSIGVDALLVGETMMRAENKAQMLDSLKGRRE